METPDPNPVEEYLVGLPARNERTAREALDYMARNIDWKSLPPLGVSSNGSKKKRAKSHNGNGNNGSQPYDGTNAPWWRLTPDEAVAIRDRLTQGDWPSETTGEPMNPTTINRFVTALRGVLRQCWKQQLMTDTYYLDAAAKLRTLPPRTSER